MKIYGKWEVHNHSDDRSWFMGVFEGFIDEIALHLADRCSRSLEFKIADDLPGRTPTGTRVLVMIPSEIKQKFYRANTDHETSTKQAIDEVQKAFENRPVVISSSPVYGCFQIEPENKSQVRKEIVRQKALAKLTEEERTALGI